MYMLLIIHITSLKTKRLATVASCYIYSYMTMHQTSGAFIPAVPAGSTCFTFAHSTYFPLSRSPSVQNKPISPNRYVTLPP